MSETFPQEFGRYQLTARLALGGMAELFLAEVAGSHGFAKTVVIKRILPHLAANEQFTKMFISEAKITAQLAHPKIAQTFELGTEGKQLFIVMEYIDGLDVLALLRECAHRRVRVPEEITVYIMKEVLDALDFAHNLQSKDGKPLGIVHRDVSPSNVLLSKRGDVKLIDFGIAHATEGDMQTKAGTLKGKYGYMSPEQVLAQVVTPKSDIFAAGVVMAEMLMGRRLFAAANELDVLLMVRDVDLSRLERFGEHIQPELSNLLRWALRKDPGDRYKDAKTFRDSLDEWLFDQRHRIGSTQLEDIVNSLYEDAIERRRQGLEEAEQAGLGDGPELPGLGDGPELPGLGEEEAKPAMAIAAAAAASSPEKENSSPELEMDLAKPEVPFLKSRKPGAASVRAPRPAPKTGDSILDFELAPADSLQIDIGTDISLEGDPSPVDKLGLASAEEEFDISEDSESFEIDFDSMGDESQPEKEDRKSKPYPPKKLPSYDSISEAVASVSPLAPDPASIDFDDSRVSSGSKVGRSVGVVNAADLEKTAPPKPPELSQGDESPDRSGSLADRSALAALYDTTAARESGKVTLSSGGVRKEIFFKRGVPEFVSSNVASELFGAYLVRTEVISSGELDMALAVMPHFGGKLGDTLVGLGLMKPLEVFRHLTRQVRSKLIEVCTWIDGSYEWFPGVPCPKQAFPLDLDPMEVYGAAALAMAKPALDSFVEKHKDHKYVAARSSVVVPELFQVSGIRQYQEQFDGNRSLSEVIAALDTENDELRDLQIVYLLINTKLIKESEDSI